MTTPNLNFSEWAAAQEQPWVPVNGALNIVDALLPKVIVSDALATPPASPAAGACYIVAATATGAWAGWEYSIAAYIGGVWVKIMPATGWKLYVQSSYSEVVYNGGWSPTSENYDIVTRFSGTPTAGEIIWFESISRGEKISADFAGSSGSVGLNPTASFSIDVQDDGVSIGTITVTTTGQVAFASIGGLAVDIAAGSRLTLVAPAPADATIADIAITIIGTTDGTVAAPSSVIPWRYVRWNITVNSGGVDIQTQEFQLLSGGTPLNWDPAVVVTNNKPNPATEGPQNLVDGNSATKWLAYAATCIVDIDNVNGIIFDEYRFMTGSDAAQRDPDSWTLEVSNDGITWTVVSTVSGAAVTVQ